MTRRSAPSDQQLALTDISPDLAPPPREPAARDRPAVAPGDGQPLLTAGQVADQLGVTERYVWRLGREGTLARIVLPGGRLVRFAQHDVDRLVADRRSPSRPPDPT